jgi:hypothetical protein
VGNGLADHGEGPAFGGHLTACLGPSQRGPNGYKKLGREAYLMYNFVSTKPDGGAV